MSIKGEYANTTNNMMSEYEIARVLKVSHVTVHNDLIRGLNKLREHIRGNPKLAERLWEFLEEEPSKFYVPVLKYNMEELNETNQQAFDSPGIEVY